MELCQVRTELKANEISEKLMLEMYCIASDKEAEAAEKMERAADQLIESMIAGEDAHRFVEEYKHQKASRNTYKKIIEELNRVKKMGYSKKE